MIPKIINFPKIEDDRGNLSFLESKNHIPFSIKRAYWIYDVPGGEIRGSHAFKKQLECIIALSGSFDVVLEHNLKEQRFSLNRSYLGLFVPNMMWRKIENFSTNASCLVLASTPYDENDYIRNYEEYLEFSK